MKETQCQRVLEFIKKHESITSLQAMHLLGCMRLASRINDLRRMGIPVRKRMASANNMYGEKVYFAEYYIEEEA